MEAAATARQSARSTQRSSTETSSRSQSNSWPSCSWPGQHARARSRRPRAGGAPRRAAPGPRPRARGPRSARGGSRRMLGQHLQVEAEAHRRPAAAEHRADLVVAPAARQRVAASRRHRPRSAGRCSRHSRSCPTGRSRCARPDGRAQVRGQPLQVVQRLADQRALRQLAAAPRPAPRRRRTARAARAARAACRRESPASAPPAAAASFFDSAATTSCSCAASIGSPASTPRSTRASARSMTRPSTPADVQRIERQLLHFEVGLQAGMAEDLGAELQRLARAQARWAACAAPARSSTAASRPRG